MPRKMIKKIKDLVYKASRKKTNYYGLLVWLHIVGVAENAKILAKKLRADQEICEIAAWLHDYAAICKPEWRKEHHLHGARLAQKILRQFNYPQEKIDQVKHCILTHRGSRRIKKQSLEAKVVTSADSITHFSHLNYLFYLAFVIHKMEVDKGTQWVLTKLERSYQKLMPEAKKIVKTKYQAIKLLLEV